MKFSVNWLREFVDLPKNPEEIAELLTRAGVETENIETRGAKIDKVIVSQITTSSAFGWREEVVICETITLSIFAPRVSIFSVSTPARVSNSAISSGFFGRSTNSRSQLTENFIETFSFRLSLLKGEGRVRV